MKEKNEPGNVHPVWVDAEFLSPEEALKLFGDSVYNETEFRPDLPAWRNTLPTEQVDAKLAGLQKRIDKQLARLKLG